MNYKEIKIFTEGNSSSTGNIKSNSSKINKRLHNYKALYDRHETIVNNQLSKSGNNFGVQGPIDWSPYGLYHKYRDTKQREQLYQAWLQAKANVVDSLNKKVIIPVAVIERHPFYKYFYEWVATENQGSINRTNARLTMKRFITDVREVWLTNLPHFKEHQQIDRNLLELETNFNLNIDPAKILQDDINEGLNGRRDVDAILNLQHQIQSVSYKRATAKAYNSYVLEEPKVSLDYIVKMPPPKSALKPLVPTIESLVDYWSVKIENKLMIRISSDDDVTEDLNLKRKMDKTVNMEIDGSNFDSNINKYSGNFKLSVSRLVPPIDERKNIKLADNSDKLLNSRKNFPELNSFKVDNTKRDMNNSYDSELENSFRNEKIIQKCLWRFTLVNDMKPKLFHFVVEEETVNSIYRKINPIRMISSDGKIDEDILQSSLLNKISIFNTDDTIDIQIDKSICEASCKNSVCIEVIVILLTNPYLNQKFYNYLTPEEFVYIVSDRLIAVSDWIGYFMKLQSTDYLSGKLSMNDLTITGEEFYQLLLSKIVITKSKFDQSLQFSISNNQVKNSTCMPITSAYMIANYLSTNCKLDDNMKLYFSYNNENSDIELENNNIVLPTLMDINQYSPEEISGDWESITLAGPSLSLQASGKLDKISVVPGVHERENSGILNNSPICLLFQRNEVTSKTKAIQVSVIVGLESPILHSPLIAGEDLQVEPTKHLNEPVDSIIPCYPSRRKYRFGSYHSISRDGIEVDLIDSPIAERLASVIRIYSSGALEGKDYPLEEYVRTNKRDSLRYASEINPNGFRIKLIGELLISDGYLPTLVFGITEAGAKPNIPGVNSRNIWHSVLAVTEDINRPRIPKDYHYMLASKESIGSPEASTFLIKLKGHEYFGLILSTLHIYEEKYASIKDKKEIFARQIALDAKIEYTEMILKTRDKGIKDKHQNEIQRAMEKKLRKITKSEEGWKRRFNTSSIVEIQGSWERRRDDRNGVIFFHKITGDESMDSLADSLSDSQIDSKRDKLKQERFVETCQWEVPDSWVGDPLEGVDVSDNLLLRSETPYSNTRSALQSRNRLATASSNERASTAGGQSSTADLSTFRASTAGLSTFRGIGTSGGNEFVQPDESWVPGKSIQFDSITPGMIPKQSVHPRIDGSDMRHLFNQEYNDESNLLENDYAKQVTEKIVVSDELTQLIAFRLGIPSNQLRPISQMTERNILNPQNAPRLGNDEDDDNYDEYSSDDDEIKAIAQLGHQVGDTEDSQLTGLDVPENRKDITKIKIQQSIDDMSSSTKVPSQQQVPYLNLTASKITKEDSHLTFDATNWRGLPTSSVSNVFFSRFNQTKVLSHDSCLPVEDKDVGIRTSNSLNSPIYLTAISPVDACHYEPEGIRVEVESIFIPNIKEELDRATRTLDRNIKREEELSKNVATDDLLLFGQPNELTSNDKLIMKQYQDDKNIDVISPLEEATKTAFISAKAGEIARMEDCIDAYHIDVNLADDNGNTLLILAVQQGIQNLKMVKLLLRRGADINRQNYRGNTVLHYCYAQKQKDLANYLIKKGANDTIVNADNLTCYEMEVVSDEVLF